MNWYLVPIGIIADGDFAGGLTPIAFGDQIKLPAGCRLHVRPAGVTGLLGSVQAISPVPDDWVGKTLEEAQAEFAIMYGRPPTVLEVF